MAVLIVTGGSRGIGKDICSKAAATGWSVAVNFARAADAADAVVDGIRASGGRAVAVRADVSDEEAVADMFDAVEQSLGPVTGLVNNAGIMGSSGRVDETDAARTRRLFEVNVLGPILCCKHAVRRMARRHGGKGGAIVNISSQAALHGGVGSYVDFAASKAALDRLTRSLGQEQGLEGIRVNGVRPGFVMTEGNIAWEELNPGWAAGMVSRTPLGRAATPGEVTAAVLWLLSDQASYVTGTIVNVNGGYVT